MILLFGAAGQVGQEISQGAKERNLTLNGLSRVDVDITDSEQVTSAINAFRPSLVINAAAYTDVDRAEDEYEAAFAANAEGAGIVAASCRTANIPILHFSTDYVFDGNKARGYLESDPIAPLGAYGRSKAEGDQRVRSENPMHLILRTSWIYGKFGKNFVKTILRLADERNELNVVADQSGCPTSTRQISDAIFAIVPIVLEGACPWGTYHFAGSGIATWFDFAKEILAVRSRYSGDQSIVNPISSKDRGTKARRPTNSSLDCSLIAKTFGIKPAFWKVECERVVVELMSN